MDSIGDSDRSRLPALDSDLLLAFITVADSGGFTTAARYLHKTQSTISLRVSTLEDRLGTRLLNRTSRHLSLTPDGQTFLVYARRLLQLQREALGALSVSSEPITLRFGLPEDHADTWLPALLERFSAAHPEVRVHIHCRMSTELLDQLDDGSLDLVLAVRHSADSGGEVVGEEAVVWAAHRDFRLDPRRSLPLALFPEQCIYRRRALQALTDRGLAWQVDSTSQSPSGLRVIVDQARALTLCELRMVPEHWRVLGEAEGLPPLPAAELEIHRSPSLTHPAFEAFVQRLREVMAEAVPATL
ncbi:LysR substrate-binding domain-containing protein [Halomonas elongata]|uniref:LysR substrate-binding domain-containing protein n=1 Tax=Halomonas elongata TaxID=2746 RepID=UPI00255B38C7|nr:LysR substrate-binding domain-containing protein [Halomonas elongata]MDL4862145.1 LysR substrate-binding domain-containing protein [Halomonas elongata]